MSNVQVTAVLPPVASVTAALPALTSVDCVSGGPTVEAVPTAEWPPADPQPGILYLRVE